MATTNFVNGTIIQPEWMNDVDPHVYDQLADAHTSDHISYTPAGAGAVATTVQSKLRESVSVFDFMTPAEIYAVQNNFYVPSVEATVTDVTTAIQAALDWLAGASFRRLLFPDGIYNVTAALDATATTDLLGNMISGYGALVTATGVVDVLTVTVNGSLLRNFVIDGLSISGATGTALVFDGKGASGEYFYGVTVRDCNLSGLTGIKCLSNFFEATIETCNIIAGTTGYGIYCENVTVGGLISSLTLFQNTTRGGINGILSVSPVTDINIIGGTYLQAQREGIRLENAQGGHITGAHVEQNWLSNLTLTEGQAGIYATVSGSGGFSIRNTYSVQSGGGQSNSVRVFIGSDAVAIVEGGVHFGGLSSIYIDGSAGSRAVFTGYFTYAGAVANVLMSINDGLRNFIPLQSNKVTLYTSPASVTPAANTSVIYIRLGNNPPINAPSFTPVVGDVVEFIFEQIGAGSNTVTWDGVYKPGAFVPTTGYGGLSTIKFRYINTSVTGNVWVVCGISSS